MRLLTTTQDNKIMAENHLLEMSIGEYSEFAQDILKKNDLQRRRVKTANRTYSLLKDDIRDGCVIPPIVLAIFPKERPGLNELSSINIIERISNAGNELLILDGLQRTYTILDLLSEIEHNIPLLHKVKKLNLRIEVYTGISKVGVLYRMLTLNTGQTPMSTRHQVEMLYSDYKEGVEGLTFISEADNRVPTGDNEFKFSDVLDGFLSYITGDYFPIDREDLVSIIKNLESLTKEDKQKDVFKLLITTYNNFRIRLDLLGGNWRFDKDGNELKRRPFAFTVNELFTKVQVLAGFGGALSFLIENSLILNLEAISNKIGLIKDDNIQDSLNLLIKHLDDIQINARKIGNEQRMYFYFFIRSLFNESNEGHLNIEKSVLQAYQFYKANTLR